MEKVRTLSAPEGTGSILCCALSPHGSRTALALGGEDAAACVLDLRVAGAGGDASSSTSAVAHSLRAGLGCFHADDAVARLRHGLEAEREAPDPTIDERVVDAAARGLEARREGRPDERRRREHRSDRHAGAGHAKQELEDAEVARARELHEAEVHHLAELSNLNKLANDERELIRP